MGDIQYGSTANAGTPLLGNLESKNFSPGMTFANIVKSFAGAGTFGLPYAILQAGLWFGLAGVFIVAALANYTCKLLLDCSERIQHMQKKNNQPVFLPTYPQIGEAAFGIWGSWGVSLFSGLMCFGVCIVYYTLIGNTMSQIIPHLTRQEIIWIIFPITLFFSLLTDTSKLAYTSVAGTIALLIAMVGVIQFGFARVGLKSISDLNGYEWHTLPSALGAISFLFCGHVIIVPLCNGSGSTRRFPRVLDVAMIFVVVINVIFAGLAYGLFGSNTQGSVIDNVNPADGDTHEIVVAYLVKIGISLEVLASFPLVATAAFNSVEDIGILRHAKAFPHLLNGEPHPLFSRNIWFYIFRAGIIALLALLASVICNFAALISLVGSLTIAATAFIFPNMFYVKIFYGELNIANLIGQMLIIAFGIAITIIGTIQSVQALVDSSSSSC